jgi:hypothetical protein
MQRVLLWIGLLLLAGFPIAAFVGVGSMALMPGCTGGSSGPASGCYLLGVINLNWLVQLGTIAFVASFFTVPISVLIFVLLGLVSLFTRRSEGNRMGKADEG